MSLTAAALALLLQAQPAPGPDPNDWWNAKVERPSPEREPLAGRRLDEGQSLPAIDNGVDPLLYRLWGLQPLQTQIVERGEMVVELWRRPSLSVRQAVIRVTVRRDGRAFVQARAGLGCCSPEIGRRVGVDAELASAEPYRNLAALPAWDAPRRVTVLDGQGSIASLCLDGISWDVTLLTQDRTRHLRRACDGAEIGQIADILTPLVAAALGRDPRIDVLFPRGADFEADRRAYDALIAASGRLEASKVP
ncbi:hypothetical protein [Caulobacter sp. NIBR2454]|uniref:hypothetical protein n=1 Tax=Caulobacter sp. NIBR2454 TaxID=3015996 RepID=UPI0022B62A36|nr:hypothetical protein [Caulobacter sp. NIBR2454]